MASIESGVLALQNELEKAKESLKDVDENIKKLTGRDPTGQRPGTNRRVSLSGDSRGRGRPFTPGGRRFADNDGQAARRIVGGAFSRLGISPRGAMRGRGRGRRTVDSDEEEESSNKPTIQSSVVLTPKEPKSRQASLDEQKQDKKSTARNRRMFGLLLGTLQKFKDEAKESKDKEDQRKQIEEKLEEKAKEEKEEIIQERRQLFQERRQTQAKLRKIEQKIEIVETSQECQAERLKLVNFIRTKAQPHIFYLPKSMNEILENKRKETAQVINELITKKQKQLEEEIEDLMADNQEHHEEEEEMEHTGEGAEIEGDKNKGEQTDKENLIVRHYRSKEDELEEQEGKPSRKRRKSSGEREGKRRSSSGREHEHSKHRRSDEHQTDVHKSDLDKTGENKRRKSDHSGDREEGRHQRSSRGEGGRSEGERDRSHGEAERRKGRDEREGHGERRRSHGDERKREERRGEGYEIDRNGKRKSHGEGDENENKSRRRSHGDGDVHENENRRRSHGDRDGHENESRRRSYGDGDGHEIDKNSKKREHRSKDQAKRFEKKEDGVKVAIDYDEQEEANEDTSKTVSLPELHPVIPATDFSNMADIPMPDEPVAPKDT